MPLSNAPSRNIRKPKSLPLKSSINCNRTHKASKHIHKVYCATEYKKGINPIGGLDEVRKGFREEPSLEISLLALSKGPREGSHWVKDSVHSEL